MEQQKKVKILKMPGVTAALSAGFNLAAEHIYLILLPVLVDLMIWLGPRLTVYQLLHDRYAAFFARLVLSAPAGLIGQIGIMQQAFDSVLKGINLVGSFTVLPLSVPSLLGLNTVNLSDMIDGKKMLAGIRTIEVHSVWVMMSIILLFSISGLILGILYFVMIARTAAHESSSAVKKPALTPSQPEISYFWMQKLTLAGVGKQILRIVALLVLAVGILMILMVPVSCVLTLFMTISPTISQIVSFFMLLSVAWLIVPIFFTIHGLFYDQGIRDSFKVSANLGKWFSAPTSFFIVAVVIISQGLNLIWSIPKINSWFLLIGIVGHAFVTTALISASFILYQNYLIWIVDNEELITKGKI